MKPVPGVRCLTVVRWVMPSVVVGAWSGALWHRYVVEIGTTIGAWQSGAAFDVTTSLAVGAGALLITRAVARQIAPPLAVARVPHWLHRIGFRPVALFAMVGLLAFFDRTIVRAPERVPEYDGYDVPPEAEESHPVYEHRFLCGNGRPR